MHVLPRIRPASAFVIASAILLGVAASGCISTDQARLNRAGSASVLEDIEPTVPLVDQVARIAGVYLNEYRELRIRGAQGPPLVVVDGARHGNRGDLSFLSSDDVARIEVVKGPRTAMYGIGGADGVLLVTTKQRGDTIN